VVKLSVLMTIQAGLFLFLLSSCVSTAVKTKDFNRPYGVVRATVQKAMPLGVRSTSRNGRTYESNYFIPRGTWEEDGTEAKERAFARATILGSGRPYTVECWVLRQRKEAGGYSAPEIDDDLSGRLATKIEEGIANRREDRNMIDDFKPF
jgi:hypothetical protein